MRSLLKVFLIASTMSVTACDRGDEGRKTVWAQSSKPSSTAPATCSFSFPGDAVGSSISCRTCGQSPEGGAFYGRWLCGRGGEKIQVTQCDTRSPNTCAASGYTGDVCIPYGSGRRGFAKKGELFCFRKSGTASDGNFEPVYCDGVQADRQTPILRGFDRSGRENYTRAECQRIGAKIITF